MPIEVGLWRIDATLKAIDFGQLNIESRLEDILDQDISIASPNWMVIGRQVRTDYGMYIDLLAMDGDGNLVVVELKRDRTYRDIVAQVLDYGSWVRELEDEQIAQVYDDYQRRYRKLTTTISIDDGFNNRFGFPIPDELNQSHELVVVASSLDASTERVVNYLAEEYGVRINAIFFRVFKDEGREYLSRAWLRDPVETGVIRRDPKTVGEWNDEYYVSFGQDLSTVRDGLQHGYIAAGGGSWYSKTLAMLEPGARIWVNVPRCGYVGVAEVTESMQVVDEFTVADAEGTMAPLASVSQAGATLRKAANDPDTADYCVRVNWLAKVDPKSAISEKGFFGNQNTVARPTSPKWNHTVERLKVRFGLEGEAENTSAAS